MRQMLLVVAAAVRSANLELAPGYQPRPARQLLLIVPRGGTLMRVREKRSAARVALTGSEALLGKQ
jgi:hypothetical protein